MTSPDPQSGREKSHSHLLRKASNQKMALKEKIVQIYEAFFQVILFVICILISIMYFKFAEGVMLYIYVLCIVVQHLIFLKMGGHFGVCVWGGGGLVYFCSAAKFYCFCYWQQQQQQIIYSLYYFLLHIVYTTMEVLEQKTGLFPANAKIHFQKFCGTFSDGKSIQLML